MRLIGGDIGGTKTRLGLFDATGGGLMKLAERTFASADHPELESIVVAFLTEVGGPCQRAAFAIAGPVKDRTARTTNLPWLVSANSLERRLNFPRVDLLNDLEAIAYGIAELTADDFLVLNTGSPGSVGNAAIIAAGTGLGMAGLFWDGVRHHPFPSEGGHADFAPAQARHARLFSYLAEQFGHVSKERVLSGPGLVNVFRYLLYSTGHEDPPWLVEALHGGDPAAAIAHAAVELSSPLPVQALDLFVSIYGAEAGNLALALLATGGVYLGGGIAPKIADKLKEPTFLNSFLSKGRMRPLLEAVPVKVILNDRAALVGAARFAALQLRGGA